MKYIEAADITLVQQGKELFFFWFINVDWYTESWFLRSEFLVFIWSSAKTIMYMPLPLGLVLRLLGYDPMLRQLNSEKSYRQKSVILEKNHMEKPY